MIPFDISNWHWIVGGDEARIWSSAARAWRAADDAVYLAWLEEGGMASRIVSVAELCDVMNAPIVAAIEAAEFKQARPVRELSLPATSPEGRDAAEARLAEIDIEIAALRASLLSEPLA